MITYERISSVNGVLRYAFYPEGDKTAPGYVEFENGKRPVLVENSDKDVKMFYAIHALNNIDISKQNGTVAWC